MAIQGVKNTSSRCQVSSKRGPTNPKQISQICRQLYVLYQTSSKLKRWSKQGDTVPTMFTKLAKQHPNKPALIIDGRSWSYQEVETREIHRMTSQTEKFLHFSWTFSAIKWQTTSRVRDTRKETLLLCSWKIGRNTLGFGSD